MGKQLELTRQLQRIAAIPHNPNLAKDIESIRARYGLDKVNEDEGVQWYVSQLKRHKVRSTWRYYFSESYPETASMKGPFDSGIRIDKDIGAVMSRYQLPPIAFIHIFDYVMKGYYYLYPGKRPWQEPFLEKVVHLNPTTGRFEVTIRNLRPSTTKKEWLNIWEESVFPYIKELRDHLGLKAFARKTTLVSLNEQMTRWAEWYQLVEIEGLTIGEALKQWEKSHPKQWPLKDIDESTVSKAVRGFREIITPTPTKD